MRLRYYCYCFILFVSVLSCKDRYIPDIQSTGTGYLVVEGVLNAGNAPTTLTVSRTKKLLQATSRRMKAAQPLR